MSDLPTHNLGVLVQATVPTPLPVLATVPYTEPVPIIHYYTVPVLSVQYTLCTTFCCAILYLCIRWTVHLGWRKLGIVSSTGTPTHVPVPVPTPVHVPVRTPGHVPATEPYINLYL